MNTTWTIAGQLPKIKKVFTLLLEILIVLTGSLTLCRAEVTSCFPLAQRSRLGLGPCQVQVP